MATTVYAENNAAILRAGEIHVGYAGSQEARWPAGLNAGWDFKATGTDLTIRMFSQNGTVTFKASIDGGAFADITPPSAATWGSQTVFTGLSDAQHTVRIRHKTGSSAGLFADPTSFISLTGATPALALPTNFAAVYPAQYGRLIKYGDCRPSDPGTGNQYRSNVLAHDSSIRFKAQCSAIHVSAIRAAQGYRLYVDGARHAGGRIVASSAFDYEWIELATGLDDTAIHEYEIVHVTGSVVSGSASIQAIGLGGTGLLAEMPVTPRGKMLVIGDSKSVGLNPSSLIDTGLSYGRKLAVSKGYAVYNIAASGHVLISINTSTSTQQGDPKYYLSQGPFDIICLMVGHNDVGGSVTAAAFEAGYTQLLNMLKGAAPVILCIQDVPSTAAGLAAARAGYKTAVQNAIAAAGCGTFVDTDSLWGTGGSAPTNTQINNNTNDGTHPNDVGYDALVTMLNPYVPFYQPSGTYLRTRPNRRIIRSK